MATPAPGPHRLGPGSLLCPLLLLPAALARVLPAACPLPHHSPPPTRVVGPLLGLFADVAVTVENFRLAGLAPGLVPLAPQALMQVGGLDEGRDWPPRSPPGWAPGQRGQRFLSRPPPGRAEAASGRALTWQFLCAQAFLCLSLLIETPLVWLRLPKPSSIDSPRAPSPAQPRWDPYAALGSGRCALGDASQCRDVCSVDSAASPSAVTSRATM